MVNKGNFKILGELEYGRVPKYNEINIFESVPLDKIRLLFRWDEYPSIRERETNVRNFISKIFTEEEISEIAKRFTDSKGKIDIQKLISGIKAGLVYKNSMIAMAELAKENGLLRGKAEVAEVIGQLRKIYGANLEREVTKRVFRSKDNKKLGFVGKNGKIN